MGLHKVLQVVTMKLRARIFQGSRLLLHLILKGVADENLSDREKRRSAGRLVVKGDSCSREYFRIENVGNEHRRCRG